MLEFELFKIGFIDVTMIDVLDILIVTFLLYRLYQTLKNTIAIQFFLGIILLLFIDFATEAFKLRSLNLILHTLSNIWLIAFLILFQPEIRRLLLAIVRAPIFSSFMSPNLGQTINEVVEAAQEMSEKHIGALIVFVRSRNFKMTLDTGVPIQGMLTKELLMSIFNSKSPLHDGAVIVQNSMIEAAGCILPLSTTVKYQRQKLGTRHRAALGISEQADVLVLVVSEETGRISIAEEGSLSLHIPVDRLEKILQERLNVQTEEDEKPLFSFAKS